MRVYRRVVSWVFNMDAIFKEASLLDECGISPPWRIRWRLWIWNWSAPITRIRFIRRRRRIRKLEAEDNAYEM